VGGPTERAAAYLAGEALAADAAEVPAAQRIAGAALADLEDLTIREHHRPHRAELDAASVQLLPVRRAGASGFLLNDATAAGLIHAGRVVAAGGALLAPSVTRRLIADFARQPRPAPPGPPSLGALTHRETGVLRLIAHGLSNTEISNTLIIAGQTTKTHVSRILAGLGPRDRVQAVVLADETGFVTPGESSPARTNPGTTPDQ